MTPTLKTGSLAYLDTIGSGLVPCKVLAIHSTGGSYPHVIITVEVTASRLAYRRGERFDFDRVVPREAVSQRRYAQRILPYNVQADDAEKQ